MVFPGVLHANGGEFAIAEIAEADGQRELPEFRMEHQVVAEDKARDTAKGGEGIRREEVRLRIGDRPPLLLGGIDYHWFLEREEPSGIDVTTLQMGWLAGAEDLLLLAWNHHHLGGTALSLDREILLLRVLDQGVVPLLRTQGTVSGRSNHLGYPGLNSYWLSFDAASATLVLRLSQHGRLFSPTPGPLLSPMVAEGDTVAYERWIRQKLVVTYQVSDDALQPAAATLRFRGLAGDSLAEISRFYLGPLAPSSALVEANPDLLPAEGEAPGSLSEERWLRIPVPEQWLLDQFVRKMLP